MEVAGEGVLAGAGNPDQPWVEPGTVIVVTEGPNPVAYFTVDTPDA